MANLTDKLKLKELAEENIYFAKRDRELIEALHEKDLAKTLGTKGRKDRKLARSFERKFKKVTKAHKKRPRKLSRAYHKLIRKIHAAFKRYLKKWHKKSGS
jgi:flagellar motor switch protein FliM